ncbi:MAG: transcription antitermination factor NusB [Candidatus Pacebacteria bacterium]|nr:transcription antitermination factor NusB [Candidatus Paceibacterota bacterium]
MANRHLSRSIVLQTLFEWDFKSISQKEALTALKRNADEMSENSRDFSFMENLLSGVLEKRKELDNIIEKAAPEWPIDKISMVDRNVLRIGLFELLFGDREEVPPKVAINESIELAKTYGGDASGKFANGVLGAVYKELGEPGKEDQSKRKKKNKIKNEDLPDDQVPVENLGGAVVFARKGKDVYLALVHDVFGHWTLSKGRIEEGEDLEQGTIREIKEELGLDIKIQEQIGQNGYIAYDPEKGKIKKQVTYFLAESSFDDITLGSSGGLDDAKWFKLADILDLNFYDDILPLVTKAVKTLVKS